MALVLVLVFLVLLSALILAFFTDVSTELVASKTFAASISTRQLSETATNFVMSQISDATAGLKEPGKIDSPILAWASQPGMIRTYLESGNPYRYYKLYSAQNMVVSEPPAGYDVNTEFLTDTPNDWHQNPAVWTDLNSPIKSTSGSFEYPIVNPGAQKSSATALDGIEGFEILKGPGFSGTNTRTPTDPTLTPNSNPAMMPARWIYVLRDGTLSAAPAAAGGEALRWDGTGDAKSIPTTGNPIVGRIAFWTDDETAKVNINTASEGTFWDRPWGAGPPSGAAEENRYATMIPAKGEYSRYAGHPAMTCLSPVLGFVMPYSSTADKKNYHFLVPRLQFGGTEAASKTATGPVGQDNERLFASVDELAFSPIFSAATRTTWITNGVTAIPENRAAEVLSKAKFFLTASSRAPDVNLFNKPRISLWPLQLDPVRERNIKDRFIAFCSSTKSGAAAEIKYYFQRYNSYSLNKQRSGDGRTAFLSSNGPIPSSCHPTMDWDLIERNRELYSYLQNLTATNIPGFGGSLKAKYDSTLPTGYSDRDQILTEMVDYIRSNVNSYSSSESSATYDDLKPWYDYAPTRNGGPVAGETQIVPLKNPTNNTRGFGRFATVTEVALVFHRKFTDSNGSGVWDAGEREFLQAFLVLELFNPSPGNASWSPHVRYAVTGLGTLKVTGSAFAGGATSLMGFPQGTLTNWVTSRVGYSGGGHKGAFMGSLASFKVFKDGGSDKGKVTGIGGAEGQYPFATPVGVEITNPNGTFSIPEDTFLDISIYSGYETPPPAGTLPSLPLRSQTLNRIKIPAITVSLPLPKSNVVGGKDDNRYTFDERMDAKLRDDGTTRVPLILGSDVIRSVEIRHDGPMAGDLRIVAALADVPNTNEAGAADQLFVPHPKYQNVGDKQAHSLRSTGLPSPGGDDGTMTLVNTATYKREPAAAARANFNTATNVSGVADFDNATGPYEDGAYVNKADEGNLATGANSYFSDGSFNTEDGKTYSPNRQIASAVAFGSLPTGVKATEAAIRKSAGGARPWQTLLFTANPSSRTAAVTNFSAPVGVGKHPGFGITRSGTLNNPPYVTVPDHLWLDFFTMPVIEPYAISEPFSTAGRINLNYQIAPFSYIRRTTGLKAVLRAVKLAAIPTASVYTSTTEDKWAIQRFEINSAIGDTTSGAKLDGTVKGTLFGFQARFDAGDIFRSASQICDISLVPQTANVSYDNIDTFWNANKRTGDNVREIPYGHIYPRVTTKSNTFTVHMRVQALQKSSRTGVTTWKEGTDQVVGEYRGSTTIERYIDAADPSLPDYAKPANFSDNLDRHYRFRVVNTKAFVR